MASVHLSNAFTQFSQDAVTGNLIFGNQLTANLVELELQGGGEASGPASNNFGHIVTWDPTEERLFYMNFMAADLLLYEWHTIIAAGSSVFPGSGAYLSRADRHTWIDLQRNIRNTNDYFILQNNTVPYLGDKGSYNPWGVMWGTRPPVMLQYWASGWIGGKYGGLKSALGFDVVFRYEPGDWCHTYNRWLIFYPGASFTGSQYASSTVDYQYNRVNSQWPHRDSAFAGHEATVHSDVYNTGTYPA